MPYVKKKIPLEDYILNLKNILKTIIFDRLPSEFIFITFLTTLFPRKPRAPFSLSSLFSPEKIKIYKGRSIPPLLFALDLYFEKTFGSRTS